MPAGNFTFLRNLQLYKASLMCYQPVSSSTDSDQRIHPYDQLAAAGIGCNGPGNQHVERLMTCVCVHCSVTVGALYACLPSWLEMHA